MKYWHSSGNNANTGRPSRNICWPTCHPSGSHRHHAPTTPLWPSAKLLRCSTTTGSMSSKCPADSTLMKSSRRRKTCTSTSRRRRLQPFREPQATTWWCKQATFCQRRRARWRHKRQGWGHLPLVWIPNLRRTSTSTSAPLMTRPNLCAGITASATWPSPSSGNSCLRARSLNVYIRSSTMSLITLKMR